ncbi:pentatricopeptide repeat-containing protein At1g71060, mitochondrial-like [Zingiber officinale]|uniref:Pentatricopeptide repeat-containing protein n=1 Tax=Zingiber officinale TaxID=94328 RepID=A0A8J5H6V9_ZINOF|nr:pentatricopeptide repeat-containing protein At1g71060, mitochondrial-like [Zingiber officinale]XP_042468125.1 pentatricopeptide repeat-containing protein At1g71060, mitochondrial-like [Zingiber officinale]KAG6520219.1 hypothetical protein ZIOFF_017257 [Zingiber officinale]
MVLIYLYRSLAKVAKPRIFKSYRSAAGHHDIAVTYSKHIHSLCDSAESTQVNPSKKEICQVDGRQFVAGGLKSFDHNSLETKFVVEPVTDCETPNSCAKICEEAERICKILSNQPNLNINSSLDEAGISVSPTLVAEVLKRLSNAGMITHYFFSWAEKQKGFVYTSEIFHHLIEALGKIKQFRLIWNLVDIMMRRGLLKRETFTLIIRRYVRAKKLKEAVESFEKMSLFGLKAELSDYNSLIDTISKSKNVKKAQEICNEMKRTKRFIPDLKTHTILLEGWGLVRDLASLRVAYQKMLDEGIVPDVVTYGIIINAFCKSGMCDDAIKIFNEMEANNCKPSPHIYCSLINGLGSEKRLDEALKYFELSKANGSPPELPTYNAVVGSYCWVLKFEDAFRMIVEMKKCGIGPNARTLEIVLQHLIKAEKIEEAYANFQSMENKFGCEPQLNTYSMMLNMFCTVERIDMAIKVWNQMNEKGIPPCMHMFSTMINGFCSMNRLDDVCRYFQEMLDRGIRPPGQLYSKVKDTLLDGGRRDLAIHFGLELDQLRNTPLHG